MTKRRACGAAAFLAATLTIGTAAADDATVTIGRPIEPEPTEPQRARPDVPDDAPIAREPELRRSAVRVALGPTGITTGKGFGYGVGVATDFGSGSVGGRLSATWLRGEGTTGSGTSSPTGDSVGQYQGEITLDLHKRGPIHPVIGMGAGVVHVSRPDHQSGFAGVGTGRFAVEYALGLEDADVRVGASLLGGVVGPIDDEIKDLRAYALTGLHLAIGF
jgi:hypothetical protein